MSRSFVLRIRVILASLMGGAVLVSAQVAAVEPAAAAAPRLSRAVAPQGSREFTLNCSPVAVEVQQRCAPAGRATAQTATFTPIVKGDLVASLANGQVNEYTPSGTLVQTLIQNASTPTGLAFDGQGNLYVTEFSADDILKVDATTGNVSVFSNDTILGDGTVFNSPESIAFSPDFSKMYVSDANREGTGGGIHVIDPTTGAGIGFYSLPSSSGSDGTGESDWLAVNSSGTLYTTNENGTQGVMQVDQSAGDVVQPSFISNVPDTPYAISFEPSGDLWLSDTSSLLEYDSSGTQLQSITNPNFSTLFATTPDPASGTVWVGDIDTGDVYNYDASGNLIGSFNTGSGIQGLALATAGAKPCSTPSVTFGAYKATALDGSCLTQNGTVYTDTGPVNLNGLIISPVSGQVSIDTNSSNEQLSADNATIKIGSFPIYTGVIPATNLTGKFSLSTDNLAKIGGLKLGGGIELEVSGTDGLTITGNVKLPKQLGGAEVALSLTIDAANGPTAASASASDFFVPIGKLKVGLKALSLSYNWNTDTWKGSVTVGLPTPAGAEIAGTIVIIHGQVSEFSITANNINRLLGYGVFLQSIGADVVLGPPPASITGSASITAGPQVDGASALALNGSLGFIFANPGDFKLTGSLVLLQGTPVSQTLSSGEIDFYTNGHITAKGQASWSIAFVSFNAMLNGWVYQTKAFSLSGNADAAIGFWHITGQGVVSSAGIAACGQPFGGFGPSVGFGYHWGGSVDAMFSSCDIGPFTAHASATVARPGAKPLVTMTLPSGLAVASFKISGPSGSPPAGTLIDPNGHQLSINPSNQGVFTSSTPKYGLGVDSAGGADYVVIDKPAGGTWTFTPGPGSSVTSVSTAQGLPKPLLSASVSGRGLHRELSWKIGRLPGQQVTFAEEANGVDHVLASNVTAHTGRVAFTPADGPAGSRSIVAIVTQNGLTRETVQVATYLAPATASIVVKAAHAGSGRGTITISPTGKVCSAVCSLPVLVGQVVTLTPRPARGSKFSWILGPCAGTGICKVKVTQQTFVTGRFTS